MTRRTALSILMPACTLAGAQRKSIETRGMYSHPKPFWDKGARLGEYGVNALFVHSGSITSELLARATSEGARVFAEFPTLNGKGYVEKHPVACQRTRRESLSGNLVHGRLPHRSWVPRLAHETA